MPDSRSRPRRSVAWRAGAILGVLAATITAVPDAAHGAGRGQAAAREGSLFVKTQVHDVAVTFAQDDYDEMIAAYSDTGEKEWIHADVEIDGRTYRDVGMRLKGNSSLGGLRRNRGGNGAMPNGGPGGPGGPGGFGGPGGNVSADEPASLPWLVELDRFVDDVAHHGVEEFVVRSSNTETALNEAVSLDLLAAAGLASQKAAPISFSVNGGEPELRLVIEHPNDEWEDANFEHDGVLYKAESTGDYSYRGDDPEAYDEVFDQETDKDNEDYAPLTRFLEFINNSDDATFARDLDEHLDVEAFARYLAFEDLVANSDDISGPGNNSYLRYDEETETMTVVAWDHNLSFGGLGGFGRTMGPAGPPVNGDGAAALPGGNVNQAPGMVPGGRPFGRSNILVTRFEDVDEFAAMYDDAMEDLRAELVASGKAQRILDRRTKTLRAHATKLVDEATIAREAAAISVYFAT